MTPLTGIARSDPPLANRRPANALIPAPRWLVMTFLHSLGQLRSLALDAQIVDNSIAEAVTVSSIWPHY
ncbi:hypothetical protein BVI434_980016 [Burkholderia vietnamiensis]|nr:hypothetical protein BVI434_980016 [Burkholderia vietnamiensis]